MCREWSHRAKRIDRLEPPEQDWRGSADQLQVLHVCHAIAGRSGGRLEIQRSAAIGRPDSSELQVGVSAG